MYAVTGQTRHGSAAAFTAWLCLCHLPVALSWSCDLKMIGNPGQPQNLSLAQTSLLCSADVGDDGTALHVGFSDSLLNRHLQGECFGSRLVANDVTAVRHCYSTVRSNLLLQQRVCYSSAPAHLQYVRHCADTLLDDCRCASSASSC